MFIGLNKWWLAIQIGTVNSILVLLHYSELLHLPPLKQAQSRISVYSCQELFIFRQGYQHQFHLPAMFRVFLTGNLSHSHLQSPSFLLTDKTVLIDILCFRRCKKTMSGFSPSLHCCSTSRLTHFMEPDGYLKGVHGDVCLSIPITFWAWKGVLPLSNNMSYITAPLTFP